MKYEILEQILQNEKPKNIDTWFQWDQIQKMVDNIFRKGGKFINSWTIDLSAWERNKKLNISTKPDGFKIKTLEWTFPRLDFDYSIRKDGGYSMTLTSQSQSDKEGAYVMLNFKKSWEPIYPRWATWWSDMNLVFDFEPENTITIKNELWFLHRLVSNEDKSERWSAYAFDVVNAFLKNLNGNLLSRVIKK